MSGLLTIALDAMGGDKGPGSGIPGAALALEENPSLRFLIFGDSPKISPFLKKYPKLEQASTVIHTDHFISADDKPAVALRNGRNSSMRLAINAVAEKQADCIVSGGNTGALMAMAKMVLKCLPGIERPAIASLLPTMGKETVMLDLGQILTRFRNAGSVCDFGVSLFPRRSGA